MEQIHVVLYPFLAQGHVIPALVLAQRFVECGIHVKLVTLKSRVPSVLDLCRRFSMQVDNVCMTLLTLSGGECPHDWSKAGHDGLDSLKFMLQHCHESRGEFQRTVSEMKSSAGSGARWYIVSDAVLDWTQDVGNNLGIPRYIFYPSPASILAGAFYVKVLHAEGRLPLRSSPDSYVHIPGLPPVRASEMNSYVLEVAPQAFREYYVHICTRIHEAAGVLVNTSEELEEVSLNALQSNKLLNPNMVRIFPVGPLLPRAVLQKQVTSEQEKCLLWLNNQPPRSVVYVSFGSLVILTAEQVQELAYGLMASEQRFLWIMRRERDKPSVDGEADSLPSGFPGDRSLLVTDWAPQLAILGHGSTGAFVTHCGWNSTLESLSFGIPVLTVPFFGDQALNAKTLVEDLRVGLKLTTPTGGLVDTSVRLLDRQRIACAVREVTSDSAFRDRARRVMAAIGTAADRSSSAVALAFEI